MNILSYIQKIIEGLESPVTRKSLCKEKIMLSKRFESFIKPIDIVGNKLLILLLT